MNHRTQGNRAIEALHGHLQIELATAKTPDERARLRCNFFRAVDTVRGNESIKDLVAHVQDYARRNYHRGGWDIIVETYTDDELAALIGVAPSPTAAVSNVRVVAKLQDERRRDVTSTIW